MQEIGTCIPAPCFYFLPSFFFNAFVTVDFTFILQAQTRTKHQIKINCIFDGLLCIVDMLLAAMNSKQKM